MEESLLAKEVERQLLEILGKDDYASLILEIANKIELDFMELLFKIAIASVSFLLFKWFIQTSYYYILTRLNKYVRIGDLIKYNASIIGRIKTYTFTTIVIETLDGYVNIPLRIWHHSYYTKLKTPDLDIRKLRKQKDELLLEKTSLQDSICNLENIKDELKKEVDIIKKEAASK